MAVYGDVQWVRNLRAAGQADFRFHGRTESWIAAELDPAAALTFCSRTLPSFTAGLPWFGRLFANVFFRLIGPELANGVGNRIADHLSAPRSGRSWAAAFPPARGPDENAHSPAELDGDRAILNGMRQENPELPRIGGERSRTNR